MVTLILLLLHSSNQRLSLQISKSIKEQCPGADFCRLLSLLNMGIHSQDIAIKVVSTTVNSSDRPTWLTPQKKIFCQKNSYTFPKNQFYKQNKKIQRSDHVAHPKISCPQKHQISSQFFYTYLS